MTGHLIHIGLPKAGSTWLQHWFEAHPQLDYCPGGIGGYRDVYAIAAEGAFPPDGTKWRVTSYEGLSAPGHASGPPAIDYDRSGRDSIAEEQARTCETLGALFPGAHILIVTRGFRSAMLSAYSQYVLTGGAETLDAAMRQPRRDFPWGYDALIGAYRARFGADKVILVPFELLQEDPGRFLAEIGRRLGLDPMPFERPPDNIAASPAELAWYPRLNFMLAGLPVPGARRLYAGLRYRRRLAWIARLLQRLAPRPAASAERIGADFLDRFRGTAETLSGEPLYAPYRADYLLE